MQKGLRYLALACLLVAPSSNVQATTEDRVFTCNGSGNSTMAMENEYILHSGYGPCWFHTGHHTYDLDGLHEIGSISGRAFTVESRFSPPSEVNADDTTALLIEASVDGIDWFTVDTVRYWLPTDRQEVTFTTNGDQAHASYLRIRQPRSLAQGLSGYLDSSSLTVSVTPVASPVLESNATSVSLDCENDIMERMDPAHPCWFGGINRYDSPSVFHTYPLGGAQIVTSVTGVATFLPWRSDDYTQNGGDRRTLKAHLFSSADGEGWTKLLTFDASYGVPAPFSYGGSVEARYLRLVAEYHKGVTTHPALKHVRGMLLDSSLTVTKTL